MANHRSEEIEQARFIKWTHKAAVRALMPSLAWIFHTPNGGLRSALAGAQMKALGAKKGVPDLLLPVKRGIHPGLAIEFKSATGSTTPEQKAWLAHFDDQKWETRVTRTAQDARSQVCLYLGMDPNDVPLLD